MIGGIQLDGVLIDSGASCNLVDYETWSNLNNNNIDCQSTKSEKKLFAYGQKEPIEVAGTFVAEIVCKASGEKSIEEFTVIKAPGNLCLERVLRRSLKCCMLVLFMVLKFVQLQRKEVIRIFVRSMQIHLLEWES